MVDPQDIACRTKVAYASRSLARRALRSMHGRGFVSLEIYRCQYCKMLHLGNPPGHQTYLRRGSPRLTEEP